MQLGPHLRPSLQVQTSHLQFLSFTFTDLKGESLLLLVLLLQPTKANEQIKISIKFFIVPLVEATGFEPVIAHCERAVIPFH